MALLFMEGFDTGDADLVGKWNRKPIAPDAGPSTLYGRNDQGIRFTSNATPRRGEHAFASSTEDVMICGAAIRPATLTGSPTNASHGFFVIGEDGVHTSDDEHCSVAMGLNGVLIAFGPTNNVLATSATGVMSVDTWSYVEAKFTVHDTTGSIVVNVNGTQVINVTGEDTRNGGSGYANMYRFGSYHLTQYSMDDLYLSDDTGSSPHNTFFGDVKVSKLLPNGNGNYSNLTGSDADQTDNYLQADENPPNESDWNGSATAADEDTYALEATTEGTGTVLGIQVTNFASKDSSGTISGRNMIRTNSTDYFGSDEVMSESWSTIQTIWAINPNDSLAWELADLDALEAGFEVRA